LKHHRKNQLILRVRDDFPIGNELFEYEWV